MRDRRPVEEPIEEPAVPGGVEVRIVAADGGAAIAEAELEFVRITMAGPIVEAVEVADDGSAQLSIESHDRTVQASATSYLGRAAEVPAGPGRIVIPLVRAASVRGRVIRADTGAPVPGARVFGFQERPREEDRRVATTADDQGRYALIGLATGRWDVFALAPGLVTRGAATMSSYGRVSLVALAVEPAVERTRDIVMEESAPLIGTVVDPDGNAVAGATVRVDGSDWNGLFERLGTVTSDADGAFELRELEAGTETWLEATHPDFVSGRSGAVAGGESARIELGAAGYVRVHATDPDGEPIEGARVSVDQPTGFHVRYSHGEVRTGADGWSPRHPVPPAKVAVYISADGHVRASREVVVQRGVTSTIEVQLERGRTLTGQIEWPPEDLPPTRVLVNVRPAGNDWDAVRDAPVADDGTFEIRPVPDGALVVSATARRGGGMWVGADDVAADAESVVVTLARGPGALAETTKRQVQVLDAAGVPIPTGKLLVTTRNPWWHHRALIVDGVVEFNIPTAAAEARVSLVEAMDATGAPLAVGRGPTGTLSPDATTIQAFGAAEVSGRVVDADGLPRAGIEVGLAMRDERYGLSNSDPLIFVYTDEHGRFRLERVAPGPWRLLANGVPWVAVRGGDKDLVLGPKGRPLHVPIRRPDGSPAPGVHVQVASADGQSVGYRDNTDEHGMCAIQELILGEPYTLILDPRKTGGGVRMTRLEGWIASEDAVLLAEGWDAQINFQGPRSWQARVAWRDSSRRWRTRGLPDQGGVVLPKLASPEIDVALIYEGEDPDGVAFQTVDVRRGAITLDAAPGPHFRLDMQGDWPSLPHGGPVDFRVADTNSGKVRSFETYTMGRPMVGHLTAGATYDVFAYDSIHCVLARGVAADGGVLTLTAIAGTSLAGRVLVEDATPTGSVEISVGDGAVQVIDKTDAHGRFVVDPLPEGTWTVRATMTHADGTTWTATLRAEAGRDDVVIALARE